MRGDARTFHAGLVRYVNYDEVAIPEDNVFDTFIHKRRAYDFEHELRAITADTDRFAVEDPLGEGRPLGVRVPVRLDQLLLAPGPIAFIGCGGWISRWSVDYAVASTRFTDRRAIRPGSSS